MKIYTLIVLLFFLGCKKNEFQTLKTTNDSGNNNIKEDTLTCPEIIKKIVESSDLNLSMYHGNYDIKIENIQSDSIIIQVFTENNISDNLEQKQLVTSTIAWLAFIPKDRRLLDITSDPNDPKNVKYKYTKLEKFYKTCSIESEKNIEIEKNIVIESKEDCKKIQVEMGSGEECIIRNTSIKNVYNDLIKHKKVDDSDLLIDKLPVIDKEIKVGKNGLISIEYTISPEKVNISMLYEGGVTEILIEQEDKNIKRSIIYNAD